MWGHVTQFGNFKTPNISRTVEGKETDGSEFYRKNAKLGQKGSSGGHVTYFSNFATP